MIPAMLVKGVDLDVEEYSFTVDSLLRIHYYSLTYSPELFPRISSMYSMMLSACIGRIAMQGHLDASLRAIYDETPNGAEP